VRLGAKLSYTTNTKAFKSFYCTQNILQANTLCKKAAISTHSKPIYFQIVLS